jgi:hypothetical protein
VIANQTNQFVPFSRLPRPIAFLYVLFLAFPAGSLFFTEQLGPELASGPIVSAVLRVLGYWLLPALLCFCLLSRREWLLGTYLSHVCCLVLFLLWGSFPHPDERGLVYGLLILSMAYMAVLFGERNLLYPMLTRDPRLWRRAKRYEIGRLVSAEIAGREMPALLVDCSSIGLALQLSVPDFRSFPGQAGMPFEVLVPGDAELGRPPMRLPVELVWKSLNRGGRATLGCRALDTARFRVFLQYEPLKREAQSRLADMGQGTDLEADIRVSTMVLWLICLGLTLLLPVT